MLSESDQGGAEVSPKKLLDLAQKLEGVARHASTHAAGVVISPEPILLNIGGYSFSSNVSLSSLPAFFKSTLD